MTRTTTLAASLAALIASIAFADVADAKIKHFRGTRDQVRAACGAQGGNITEGMDSQGRGLHVLRQGRQQRHLLGRRQLHRQVFPVGDGRPGGNGAHRARRGGARAAPTFGKPGLE